MKVECHHHFDFDDKTHCGHYCDDVAVDHPHGMVTIDIITIMTTMGLIIKIKMMMTFYFHSKHGL
jgi:hypothetical protein